MNDVAGLTALMASVSERRILPLNEAARQPESTAPLFFCVHSLTGAGGADYLDLAEEIGADVRFFGIQAPKKLMLKCESLDLQHSCAPMLQLLVQTYADDIVKRHPQGEINLGGWSAGAMVALDVAKALQARGRDVGLLVSFDGAPMHSKSAGPKLWYVVKVLGNLPRAFAQRGAEQLKRQLSDELGKLRRCVTRRKEPPVVIDPALGSWDWSLFPSYQQNFMVNLYHALEQAKFTAFEGAVVVYKAKTQPIRLRGIAEFWKRIAPDSVIVQTRGTHDNLISKPFVTPLAADLSRRLNGLRSDIDKSAPRAQRSAFRKRRYF